MFILYEFSPFCIDNVRVIYRKIRYISLQVSVEEQVYFTAAVLFEICMKAIPSNTREYMYLCLIPLLSSFIMGYYIFVNGYVFRRSQ